MTEHDSRLPTLEELNDVVTKEKLVVQRLNCGGNNYLIISNFPKDFKNISYSFSLIIREKDQICTVEIDRGAKNSRIVKEYAYFTGKLVSLKLDKNGNSLEISLEEANGVINLMPDETLLKNEEYTIRFIDSKDTPPINTDEGLLEISF